MKQLIIAKGAYTSKADYSAAVAANPINVTAGELGLFYLSTGLKIDTAIDTTKGNFTVICGRGKDKMPFNFPEVDVKSLTVEKAFPKAAVKFTASLTIPATEKGKHYTIVISKMGTVFNERSNWTFTNVAKETDAAVMAKYLVDRINDNKETLGLTASNTGGAITLTAVNAGDNFNVQGADELLNVNVTITEGVKATLDKTYILDLSSRCRGNKGFYHADAKAPFELYPGWPEEVEDTDYLLYTLRFAVPRMSAKQRDEVVYQTLHIAVPKTGGPSTTLDTIFGTPTADPTVTTKPEGQSLSI